MALTRRLPISPRFDLYWGSLMARGLVVDLPVAILYAAVIDRYSRGLAGAATN